MTTSSNSYDNTEMKFNVEKPSKEQVYNATVVAVTNSEYGVS